MSPLAPMPLQTVTLTIQGVEGVAAPVALAPTLTLTSALDGRVVTVWATGLTGFPAPALSVVSATLNGAPVSVTGAGTSGDKWSYAAASSYAAATFALSVVASNGVAPDASGEVSLEIPADLFASTVTATPVSFSVIDVVTGAVNSATPLALAGSSSLGETLEVATINSVAAVIEQWIPLAAGTEIKTVNANGLLFYRNTVPADQSLFATDTFSQQTQDVPFTLRGIGSGDTASSTLTIVYEGTGPFAASLINRRPAWAEIRLAAPNSFDANAYTTLGGVVRNADVFVSENLSKIGFIADGSPDAAGALAFSFNEFDAQAATMAEVLGAAPDALPFDWHGAVWHSSLTPQLVARLMAQPAEAKAMLTTILDAGFAHRPWLGFDVNEVQRTTETKDQQYDYWRGPIYNPPDAGGVRTLALKKASDQDHTSNGSIWYQAFSEAAAADAAYWPHNPGYWWLHTVGWANANGKKVVYQDFNAEAGRLWGTAAAAPAGYTDASAPRSDEMLKRRRILDAINYALVHGYNIDAVALQSHIRTDRMLDENDLAAFLRSLWSMGVGVEVTELDVEPSGLPLGYPASHIDAGATEAETAEILAYAGAYTRRYLDILLRHSPLARIGGWSDWAPPGGLRRVAMVDRAGVTVIGEAVVAALNAAVDPALRTPGPVQRRYSFVNGVASDLWRAATNPATAGFPITGGNASGTMPAAGSGGAVLPLTNPATPVPGDPVGPVWFDGTQVQNYDPASMSLSLQWYEDAAIDGARLTLMAAGAPVLTVRRTGADVIAENAGGATVTLGAGAVQTAQRVAVSWTGGVATMALDGGAVMTLAMPTAPQQVAVMGDGAAESAVRATLLELLRDPMDAATVTAWSVPEGAHVASAAQVTAGTNFYAPRAFTAAAPGGVVWATFDEAAADPSVTFSTFSDAEGMWRLAEVPASVTMQFATAGRKRNLMVAGGGQGGNKFWTGSGGGAYGEVIEWEDDVVDLAMPVVIGAGGVNLSYVVPTAGGQNSTFSGQTARGGGYGGGWTGGAKYQAIDGGGQFAGANTVSLIGATHPAGFKGGDATQFDSASGNDSSRAGGGGAGAAGDGGDAIPGTVADGGDGGAPYVTLFTGVSREFGRGGGGGALQGAPGSPNGGARMNQGPSVIVAGPGVNPGDGGGGAGGTWGSPPNLGGSGANGILYVKVKVA